MILPPETIADAELKRLHKVGVRGVRFVSDGHAKNLPRILPGVAKQAMDLGWPVHFYPKGEDLVQYEKDLLALPNQIVLNHFAAIPAAKGVNQPAFQALLRMLDTGRVWVKLSGPMRCVPGDMPYAEVTSLARALIARAPRRMLWGSDWPHVNMYGRPMPNDGDLFDLLLEWAPDAGGPAEDTGGQSMRAVRHARRRGGVKQIIRGDTSCVIYSRHSLGVC